MRSLSLRQTRVAATISSAATLTSGLLGVVVLILIARAGRSEEIGAYTAGTVAAAMFANVLSVGTTMHYVAGRREERAAVAAWRVLIVFPSTCALVLASALFYGHRGYAPLEVVASGLAVALNNIAELAYATLQRSLRITAAAVVVVMSKAIVLVLVLLNWSLAAGVLFAALIQLLILELLCRQESCVTMVVRAKRRMSLAVSGPKGTLSLGAFSVSEMVAGRFDSFLISVVSSPHTTGVYGVVYTVFSSLAGVLYAGVNIVLPLYRRALDEKSDVMATSALKLESAATAVACITAVFLLAFGSTITTMVLGRHDRQAVVWIMVLALALPPLIYSRSVALRQVASRRYGEAARIIVPATIVGLIVYVVVIPTKGPIGGPLGTVLQEVVACVLAIRLVRRRR